MLLHLYSRMNPGPPFWAESLFTSQPEKHQRGLEMRVPYSGACSCGRLFDLLLPPSMVVYGVPPGPAWPQAVLFSSLLKVVTTEIALGAQVPRIEFNLGLLHFPFFDLWRFGVRHKILGNLLSQHARARRNVISWYDLVLRRRPCVVGLEWRSLQRWSWRSHELLQEAILFLNLNTTCCEIKPYLSCVYHAKQSQNSHEPKTEHAVKLHKEVAWTRHMLYPPCQVGATTRSTRSIWGSAGTCFHTSFEWTTWPMRTCFPAGLASHASQVERRRDASGQWRVLAVFFFFRVKKYRPMILEILKDGVGSSLAFRGPGAWSLLCGPVPFFASRGRNKKSSWQFFVESSPSTP